MMYRIPLIGVMYRQLYFLQLENYNLGRFWALLPRSYAAPKSGLRQKIEWTTKCIAIANLALFIEILLAGLYALFVSASLVYAAAIFILTLLLYIQFHFIFLSLAVLLIAPLDAIAKNRIIAQARRELAKHPNLKIVGIAGSYGKTTMKEVLATVLSEKYNVLSTPGNLNTPLGISRTILQSLRPDTEVFVVEMGEHYPGDLKYLTELVPPEITVITGIGEAHLVRFGTFEKLVGAIFEAVEGTRRNGFVVLNADDMHITENYQSHTGGREVVFFNSHKSPRSLYVVQDEQYHDDGSGISFKVSKDTADLGEFSVSLLGEYALGVSVAALIVGERLGLTTEEIRRGLLKVAPVPHRLQVLPSQNGVLVIDDSYNGNPEGARYAIETLSRFTNRRKVYITPGLVETGGKTENVHREIGRLLAGHADIVVLIQNSVTPFIAEELGKQGFPKENIHWFNSALEAHAAIPSIVKAGDVVIFQNDWPDNYV